VDYALTPNNVLELYSQKKTLKTRILKHVNAHSLLIYGPLPTRMRKGEMNRLPGIP
jgi:hypothetical protein